MDPLRKTSFDVDAADEFDEIDDQLPVKKGQSPEDRAKDIESILE